MEVVDFEAVGLEELHEAFVQAVLVAEGVYFEEWVVVAEGQHFEEWPVVAVQDVAGIDVVGIVAVAVGIAVAVAVGIVVVVAVGIAVAVDSSVVDMRIPDYVEVDLNVAVVDIPYFEVGYYN